METKRPLELDGESEHQLLYKVVINDEEQYSIWPAMRPSPAGWRDAGRTGARADCLEFIRSVWTDMRPLSLRRIEEENRRRHDVLNVLGPLRGEAPGDRSGAAMGSSLVTRLCRGENPVIAIVRPTQTLQAFRERLNIGYLHLAFTGTAGGTELGVRLDRKRVNTSDADLYKGEGRVRLAGTLELDYVRLTCVANIDIATFDGTARLERDADGHDKETYTSRQPETGDGL